MPLPGPWEDEQVQGCARALARAAARCSVLLVPSFTRPGSDRGLGLGDLDGGGHARALLELNLCLAEALDAIPNAFLLDADRWLRHAGRAGHNPKFWYLGKIPFTRPVFAEAARDIRAALSTLAGQARKLVVVDLDDTLWGGVVGEVGPEGLALGGHDAIGEAFVDFQRALRALKSRGVMLAIASKNREAVALDALRHHPEMLLRPEDFVAWRIDWNDKAANIASMVDALNLGLASVVFIDDNPAERARVREALPEVLVPEWPADRMLYADTLRAMDCFDTTGVSAEDRARTDMMQSEGEREAARSSLGSLEEWLAGLGLRVVIEPFAAENRKRIAQLFNKTNQFNLATRRLTEAEIEAWLAGGERALFGFRVSDRYGDSGLCGIASVDASGDAAQLCDLILSCRVFGRGIEQVMLTVAADYARTAGHDRLEACHVPTSKNEPCLDFLKNSTFERGRSDLDFHLDLGAVLSLPDYIEVERS